MQKELRVTERGTAPTRYEVKEDGSLLYDCVKCGTTTITSSDIMVRWLQVDGWEKKFSFLCVSCFKKSKDDERDSIKNTRSDDIAYAQSWNLAVALTAPLLAKIAGGNPKEIMDAAKADIEDLQKYFYKKLTTR